MAVPIQASNLEEVAPGVYAALQPEARRFSDSNSVILITERDVVVVDAQADGAAVEDLIEEIAGLTERPVSLLVNTHWHSDHTQGNEIYRRFFGSALTIVGHRSLSEDVPQRAAAYLAEQAQRLEAAIPEAEQRLEAGLDQDGSLLTDDGRAELAAAIERARHRLDAYRTTTFLTPDVSYEESLVLHRGWGEIRLLHFRAHTRGDTVLHLPKQKVLITGDLLDDLPYGGHGYPTSWIAALQELESLDFEILIPGHGRIYRGQEGREQIRIVRELFESVVDQVRDCVDRGLDLEATQQAVELATFRRRLAKDDPVAQRAFDDFMPETVARAWAEARGESLP